MLCPSCAFEQMLNLGFVLFFFFFGSPPKQMTATSSASQAEKTYLRTYSAAEGCLSVFSGSHTLLGA